MANSFEMAKFNSNEEIQILQEYLRIPSMHPDVNYESCVTFLKQQAENLGLPCTVERVGEQQNPVVIMTWTGTEPKLPSIVLNSHMDVAPVFEELWTHPPFGAEIDENGRIYARGTQDMKSIGMQYLAAIRALKNENVKLKRTFHVIFVPDEELGGYNGMAPFIETNVFKSLRIGFALDEGMASENDEYPVYFAERAAWQIYFKCSGTAGHGSLLLENTAGEKVRCILDRFMDYRRAEAQKLIDDPTLTLGDVTSINLVEVWGGILSSVIPPLITIGFDVRISDDVDHEELESWINRWCEEAGGGIEVVYTSKDAYDTPTKLNNDNKYWLAFKSAMEDDLKLKIVPQVYPGGTDSRYFRRCGIPSLGFSPINNTKILLHENDEYIGADTYLAGINIYKKLIMKLGNTASDKNWVYWK